MPPPPTASALGTARLRQERGDFYKSIFKNKTAFNRYLFLYRGLQDILLTSEMTVHGSE